MENKQLEPIYTEESLNEEWNKLMALYDQVCELMDRCAEFYLAHKDIEYDIRTDGGMLVKGFMALQYYGQLKQLKEDFENNIAKMIEDSQQTITD